MSEKNRREKEARLHQLQQEQLILQSKLSVIQTSLQQVNEEIDRLLAELSEPK